MNICMIPVRKGSQRLAKKNYLRINNTSIYEIAIKKALESNVFDRVVLNTDDIELKDSAYNLGIDFYLRNKVLSSSKATSDIVVI